MSKQLIFGNEPYLIRQYKGQIEEGVEFPQMNLLFSDEFGEREARFVEQYPFCGVRKVLVLEMAKLKISSELSTYLKDPNPAVDVHVFAEAVDKRTSDFKLFKEGERKACDKVARDVLEKSILQYVKKNGARIKPDAFEVLLNRLNYHGSDEVNLYNVYNAVKKLCLFGEITVEAVEAAVTDNAREDVFRLLGLMTQKRNVELFKEADVILRGKDNNCIGVLSLLLRSFRLAFKKACGCGMAEMGVSARTSLPKMTKEQADEGMALIQRYVNGVKKGLYAQDLALKLCFGELCELLQPNDERVGGEED